MIPQEAAPLVEIATVVPEVPSGAEPVMPSETPQSVESKPADSEAAPDLTPSDDNRPPEAGNDNQGEPDK